MTKSDDTKKKWIEKGYEHFALFGPENLSINKLSKEMGVSRASFYHYFGDMDIFIEELLEMHWQISREFNSVGKKECKRYFPDLYVLLAQEPVALKFSRQLFLNRKILAYIFYF